MKNVLDRTMLDNIDFPLNNFMKLNYFETIFCSDNFTDIMYDFHISVLKTTSYRMSYNLNEYYKEL